MSVYMYENIYMYFRLYMNLGLYVLCIHIYMHPKHFNTFSNIQNQLEL